MTEIGAVPEEWEVMRLGNIAEKITNHKYNEPQINADKRRYLIAKDFSKIIHRKGHKERKAAQHEPLCPLCSPWLNTISAPAHGRAPPEPALPFMRRRAQGDEG